MNKTDELKDRVVEHARNWRRAQKTRIGSENFQEHQLAKDEERFSSRKLGEVVDLLESQIAKEK